MVPEFISLGDTVGTKLVIDKITSQEVIKDKYRETFFDAL